MLRDGRTVPIDLVSQRSIAHVLNHNLWKEKNFLSSYMPEMGKLITGLEANIERMKSRKKSRSRNLKLRNDKRLMYEARNELRGIIDSALGLIAFSSDLLAHIHCLGRQDNGTTNNNGSDLAIIGSLADELNEHNSNFDEQVFKTVDWFRENLSNFGTVQSSQDLSSISPDNLPHKALIKDLLRHIGRLHCPRKLDDLPTEKERDAAVKKINDMIRDGINTENIMSSVRATTVITAVMPSTQPQPISFATVWGKMFSNGIERGVQCIRDVRLFFGGVLDNKINVECREPISTHNYRHTIGNDGDIECPPIECCRVSSGSSGRAVVGHRVAYSYGPPSKVSSRERIQNIPDGANTVLVRIPETEATPPFVFQCDGSSNDVPSSELTKVCSENVCITGKNVELRVGGV